MLFLKIYYIYESSLGGLLNDHNNLKGGSYMQVNTRVQYPYSDEYENSTSTNESGERNAE